jgi:hypothetical protein
MSGLSAREGVRSVIDPSRTTTAEIVKGNVQDRPIVARSTQITEALLVSCVRIARGADY